MDRPNVVLIVMDTARAKSVLGRRDVMPNLHRIAEDGVMFSNAFANSPWTLPSHASLMTGQYLSEHDTHAGSKNFDPGVPTLAERLGEEGYNTAAYSNNTWISPEFGFDRGFDNFAVGWELVDGGIDLAAIGRSNDRTRERIREVLRSLIDIEAPISVLNTLYSGLFRRRYDGGAKVTNWRIKRWLTNGTVEEPFFLFVNYFEPHLEYDPPDEFRYEFLPADIDPSYVESVNQDAWEYICNAVSMNKRDFRALNALYEGELAYLDHRIGRLYDFFAEQGLLEETVFIVTGDHGENIGDHGLMDHQYSVHDSLINVPVVISHPSVVDSEVSPDALVELRDLYPTIVGEFAGVESPSVSWGDLPPRNVFTDSRDRVVAQYISPQPSMTALDDRVGDIPDSVKRFDRGLRALRTMDWKYVEGSDGSEALYHVRMDPEERVNVSEKHPDRVDRFAARLRTDLGPQRYVRNGSDTAMNPTTRDRLEQLGYLQ